MSGEILPILHPSAMRNISGVRKGIYCPRIRRQIRNQKIQKGKYELDFRTLAARENNQSRRYIVSYHINIEK